VGRSGQKNAQRPFWERLKKKVLPHQYLEDKLIQLEKLDEEARLLWADFNNYLADERDKVLEDIKESLHGNAIVDYVDDNLSRISSSKFSRNPLSSKGSFLVPPGGRFNIGQSISYNSYFSALYLANDFDTAFAEKYHGSSDIVSDEGLTIEDLGLRKPDSFTHIRSKIELSKVIDLRNNSAIEGFYKTISNIEMPNLYKDQAQRLNISMVVSPDPSQLRESIFATNYEQWDYWIDQPSPSQWFGHYVRLAGIQGIIYPSVRSKNGYNIAIYLDNFEDSDSKISILDECDFIEDDLKIIDKNNFKLFT